MSKMKSLGLERVFSREEKTLIRFPRVVNISLLNIYELCAKRLYIFTVPSKTSIPTH
jgi:hypothetical protein